MEEAGLGPGVWAESGEPMPPEVARAPLFPNNEGRVPAKQKVVDELNFLSENNPAEYDRVMALQFEKEKAELEEREAKAAKRKRIKEAKEKKRKEDKAKAEKIAAANGGIVKPTGPPLMLF